jgi:hypothetical protein
MILFNVKPQFEEDVNQYFDKHPIIKKTLYPQYLDHFCDVSKGELQIWIQNAGLVQSIVYDQTFWDTIEAIKDTKKFYILYQSGLNTLLADPFNSFVQRCCNPKRKVHPWLKSSREKAWELVFALLRNVKQYDDVEGDTNE